MREIKFRAKTISEVWDYNQVEDGTWVYGLYRDDVDFIVFDVLIGDIYLKREDVEDIAKYFKLDIVPVLFEGKLQEGVDYVKTHRASIVAKNGAEIEGLVARPKVELKDRMGRRIITKIKWCDIKEML